MQQDGDKKKLAFFVKQGLDSFLGDIITGLSDEYETKKIIVTNYNQIDDGMQWADICWFEWCDELVACGSNPPIAKEKKIICRLHRYEALTDYPKQVNWQNVDKLIIVTKHLIKFLEAQIPDISKKVDIVTINNGVNLDKYEFKERKNGFNTAYVGYIHSRKNPVLLLQIMNALVKKDKRYKLYIAGQFQEPLIELYWNDQINKMNLNDNIIFQGWQSDIGSWLEDKNYILSTSIHESFGYGIAEAMARGIKPVIHNFLFADEIWDKKFMFSAIDEAVNMICENDFNSKEYRKFIEDNYSLEKQTNVVNKLIENLFENKISKLDFPKVTIGVTNYNAGKYLNECLNSILNQNYKNVEILIVDDKSQDDSPKILKEYEKKYENIEVIYHEENSGSPDLGRREIIEKAKGDYFMLFDSDDFFQNEYAIEKLIRVACEDKNMDYVYCNLEIVNDKGEKINRWQYEQYDGERIVRDTFKRFGSGILTMKGIFKSKFFKDNNITYLSNETAGDTLTALSLLKNNMKVKFLDEDLISYRQHQNNFTFDVNKRIKAVVNIEEYIITNFDETIYFPEIKWNEYDDILRKATKAYLIGMNYFNLLNLYYEGKWMPWNNTKVINEENILIHLNRTKELIIKYFTESCTFSTDFSDKIFDVLKQIEKIFGIRIVLNEVV